MIKQRDLGTWIFFIIISLYLGGVATEYLMNKEKELDTSTPTYALSIENHSFCTSRYGTRAICGTVLNNSANTYSLVSLDINLYDESGALIGNIYDSIRNLDAGKQWKFETLLTENATSYSIKVKGY